MKKYLFLGILSIAFLCSLVLYQQIKFSDGKLHLVICDVGQGDGIFVRTPTGKNIVIDGGPDDKIESCLSHHLPFWDRKLDLVLLTHPHADHLTGLINLVNRYSLMHYATEKVENPTFSANALKRVLAVKNVSATFVFSGDRYTIGDGTGFLTVWPRKEWFENQLQTQQDMNNLDVNGFSVIELLTYGKFRALLTGDAGVVVEDQIAEAVGRIDVLKVPHHGSRTGMSEHFLQMIQPQLAVISVGKGNKYGHPAPYSLGLLKNAGAKTLRTDQNGEVEVVTDGKSWSFRSQR